MKMKVIKFYKKNLGTYNLVFKHMRFWYYCMLSTPVLFVIMGLSYSNTLNLGDILLFAIAVTLITAMFNRNAKGILKIHHGIISKGHQWHSDDAIDMLRNREKNMMLECIRSIDKYCDEIDLKHLSDEIFNEARKIKVEFPLVPSFFIAIFFTVSNALLGWFYSPEITKNVENVVTVTAYIAIFSLMGIVLYSMLKPMVKDTFELLFNRQHKEMVRLAELLCEIQLDMEKESRRKSKKCMGALHITRRLPQGLRATSGRIRTVARIHTPSPGSKSR